MIESNRALVAGFSGLPQVRLFRVRGEWQIGASTTGIVSDATILPLSGGELASSTGSTSNFMPSSLSRAYASASASLIRRMDSQCSISATALSAFAAIAILQTENSFGLVSFTKLSGVTHFAASNQSHQLFLKPPIVSDHPRCC